MWHSSYLITIRYLLGLLKLHLLVKTKNLSYVLVMRVLWKSTALQITKKRYATQAHQFLSQTHTIHTNFFNSSFVAWQSTTILRPQYQHTPMRSVCLLLPVGISGILTYYHYQTCTFPMLHCFVIPVHLVVNKGKLNFVFGNNEDTS